jgi:hypothetical protein
MDSLAITEAAFTKKILAAKLNNSGVKKELVFKSCIT